MIMREYGSRHVVSDALLAQMDEADVWPYVEHVAEMKMDREGWARTGPWERSRQRAKHIAYTDERGEQSYTVEPCAGTDPDADAWWYQVVCPITEKEQE